MNTALARTISTPRRLALALTLAAAGLVGCGGGGEDVVDDPYVNWTNSVNGVVVLDANNDRFAVRSNSRALVDYSDGKALDGITVNGFNVYISGTLRGTVTQVAGTGGSSVAQLLCTSGRPMDITATSTTYTWRCT
jgi:hypothetical protein